MNKNKSIVVSKLSRFLKYYRFNLNFISLSIPWIVQIFKFFRKKSWKLKFGRSFNRRSKENWQAWEYRTVQRVEDKLQTELWSLTNHRNHIFILNSISFNILTNCFSVYPANNSIHSILLAK